MSPEEAAIFSAWKNQINYEATVQELEDCFQGVWESFEDYANEVAIDFISPWPEEAQRYFDEAKFTRDLRYDYELVETPDHKVAILNVL